MAKREDVVSNIKELSPKTYVLISQVCADEALSEKIFSECLSLLVIRTKGHALAAHTYSDHIFKQTLKILGELLINRKEQINTQASSFYRLPLFQRFLLLLRYRLHFKEKDIFSTLGGDSFFLQEQLYLAKNTLESFGELSLERI